MTMRLLNLCFVCVVLLSYPPIVNVAYAQSNGASPNNLHFYDETFDGHSYSTNYNDLIRQSKHKGSSPSPTLSTRSERLKKTSAPQPGQSIPSQCINVLRKGNTISSKKCLSWMKEKLDSNSPTAAPAPPMRIPNVHGHEEAPRIEHHSNSTVEIILRTIADTFIEKWRPDSPLGSKERLKIDAVDGVPTKVTMLKFDVGKTLQDYYQKDKLGINDTVTAAKLRLFAITETSFGGWVEQMNSDWDEKMTVWNDYVSEGENGDLSAQELLPNANRRDNLVGSFGVVSAGQWYEADLTPLLQEIFDAIVQSPKDLLSLRITTNSSDGLIFSSRENITGVTPELILNFGPKNDIAENNGTELANNFTEDSLGSPTAAPSESLPDSIARSALPTSESTRVPEGSSLSPSPSDEVTLSIFPTNHPTSIMSSTPSSTEMSAKLTVTPTISPTLTHAPTSSSLEASLTGNESIADKSVSIVSSSFKMTIIAIEEFFRSRNLRIQNNNVLYAFVSVDEKERPAIKQHLMYIYSQVLSSAPKDVSLAFEDEVVVETIPKSSSNDGGITRTSTFRVIGMFNDNDIGGVTTVEAGDVLDQATLYAFIGAQKETFLEILSNIGLPILSETAIQDVTVSKVQFSIGQNETFQKIIDDDNSITSKNEEKGNSSSWIPPALISGAAILVIASSAAALIMLRHRHKSLMDDNDNRRKNDSPRSLEGTAALSSPSPAIFADRWKKKKFDYAEFSDDPDMEDSACEITPNTSKYLNQPAHDIKFSQFMSTSFDDSSVSDVSAHILGAKSMYKGDGESFLLDTTLESYNMEAMSALDNVHLDSVLQLDRLNPLGNHHRDKGSLSSNLRTNSSMDVHSTQIDHAEVTYATHLITLDMLRNNNHSLMTLPPPPSDAASDSSSHQDTTNLTTDLEYQNQKFVDEIEDTDENPVSFSTHLNTIWNVPENLCPELIKETSEQKDASHVITHDSSHAMKILKPHSMFDLNTGEEMESTASSAEIYIPSESDNESSSVNSATVIGRFPKGVGFSHQEDGDICQINTVTKSAKIDTEGIDDKQTCTQDCQSKAKINSSDMRSKENQHLTIDNTCNGRTVNAQLDTDPTPNYHDTLKVMNSTLNECMKILDRVGSNLS